MLGTDLPIAWKNMGIISENTTGIKLVPIILNAVCPIASTCSSFENKPINVLGNASKHIMPKIMPTAVMSIASFITFFARMKLCRAKL